MQQIQKLYTAPTFKVKDGTNLSDTFKQLGGIRQGCPLSPYLFVVAMSAMFQDIERQRNAEPYHTEDTIPIANFKDVLYADDTALISGSTKAINAFIAAVETNGKKYGLQLNRDKCEFLCNTSEAAVKYKDGQPMKRAIEVKYLG